MLALVQGTEDAEKKVISQIWPLGASQRDRPDDWSLEHGVVGAVIRERQALGEPSRQALTQCG